MSRIGKKEIFLPEGVEMSLKNEVLTVKGSKGSLVWKLPPAVEVKILAKKILVFKKREDKASSSAWGTTRQIIANMVVGVSEGWSKTLEVVGTGYRATLEGGKLVLSLGFGQKLEVIPPPAITFSVSENKITVFGLDKALVGQVAERLRHLHPPDPYKGKGMRYQGEKVKLKPGKAAKVGVGALGGKP